jgi:competence protein ComGC
MVLAAAIAAWFVARDAPNFSLIQALVLLIIMAVLVLVAIFWAIVRDKGN